MSVIVSAQQRASVIVQEQGTTVRVSVPKSSSIVVSSPGPQGPAGAIVDTAILQLLATINEDVTLEASNNGLSVGPVTIASGWSVTVPSGAVWVVV